MRQNFTSLSLEQKIGQLFFIGIPGPEIDLDSKNLLETICPGGICLFGRNVREASQTRLLLENLRELAIVEPILSIDQEGGLVDRLRRFITPMPAAGSLRNTDDSKRLAEITAEILRILGFNTNFAPVVDIPTAETLNIQNGLQSRFLGNDIEQVLALSESYLETLQSGGIIGCLKHFPGIGSSRIDSHDHLPSVELTRDELSGKDLVPYQMMLPSTLQIMVGHAAYPNLDLQEQDQDGKLLPSSLSFNVVTGLLRQDIGFNGLVVTDDLEMGAILENYGIGEAAKMAFTAGVDMLLICAHPEAIRSGYDAVKFAVETGEITEKRLDESLRRIFRFKAQMSPPLTFDEKRLAELSREIDEFNGKLR